jgi:putative tricarboxylic transport membrane protein
MKFKLLKKSLGLTIAAGIMAMGAAGANAADMACDTAKLIVPWGPGGGTAVIFGQFEKTMNAAGIKPAIKVVTIPGQGGNKGSKEALKAKADGCTLFAIHQSAIVAYINGVVNFNWDAFDTVAHLTSTPEIIGASGKAPYTSLENMLEAAKAKPGQIPTGVTMGATSHFLWLVLGDKTGTSYKYVPFQGGTAGRITGLLSGAIELGGINLAAARTNTKGGKLKAFAIAADQRNPLLPDVPTLKERGIDMTYALNRGIVVPKGTSPDIINHWAAAFKKATEDKAFQDSMAAKGTSLNYLGPKDYAAWFQKESDTLIGVATKMGISKIK